MAKVYTGKDGSLLVDGVVAGKVINWSVEGQADVLETTTLGDSFRNYETGLQGFTGSATLLFYADDAGKNDALELLRKAKSGAKTSLIVRLGTVGSSLLKDTSLSCIITSYQYGASVGEIVQASISFTVSGEPSYLV